MDNAACAHCLLGGVNTPAVAIFDGASVCAAHLTTAAARLRGTALAQSQAAISYTKNVTVALTKPEPAKRPVRSRTSRAAAEPVGTGSGRTKPKVGG
jgi:hypothetical protein